MATDFLNTLSRRSGAAFLLIMSVYLALSFTTLSRQGIGWDEQTDLDITRSYLVDPGAWLDGSENDPSQARLPMAVVALVFQLSGTRDLVTARAVSVLAGALTIVATFLSGRRRFGVVQGLIAAVLLATSPFFLSFARSALTEGDIFAACGMAWLLYFGDRLDERLTIGRAALTGVVFGLALSAKATLLVVVPAIWLIAWQARSRRALSSERSVDRTLGLSIAFVWVSSWLVASLSVASAFSRNGPEHSPRLLAWIAFASAWLLALAWASWRRHDTGSPLLVAAFITVLALLTFLVVPPEHLTNPSILEGLKGRFDTDAGFSPGFVVEAAAFHLLCIVFKSGPLAGGGMLIAFLVSIWQCVRRPEIRLPVLLALGYSAGILMLPLAQTFYTVPILPILAALAGDQATRLMSSRKIVATGAIGVAMLSVAVDLTRCYPDYNLNGYQWLGTRIIAGRPSIGYRSVVQTPSDGVQQVFEWLNANARQGEVVRAYVTPWHIVRTVAATRQYELRNSYWDRSELPDFVVTDINALIPQRWWSTVGTEVFVLPYDQAWLEANYVRAFAVRRAFGIEVATVWRKKS